MLYQHFCCMNHNSCDVSLTTQSPSLSVPTSPIRSSFFPISFFIIFYVLPGRPSIQTNIFCHFPHFYVLFSMFLCFSFQYFACFFLFSTFFLSLSRLPLLCCLCWRIYLCMCVCTHIKHM